MASSAAGAQWVEVLGRSPLFADLSQRHLRAIASMGRVQEYPAHSPLVREGDIADSFYVVLEGEARVRVPGKRAVPLGPGEVFGEVALLDGSPRSATVLAVGDVRVLRIGRTDFLRLLRSEPTVAIALLRTLAHRLRLAQPAAPD